MHPVNYLGTVEELMNAHGGSPRDADLRKAVSAAYYAVFYALCRNTADCFIGAAGAERSERAWRQAFRAVDHGFARRQCQNRTAMAGFPPGIQSFAESFIYLQEKRHAADYDPNITLDLEEVQDCLDEAAQAVAALDATSQKDRCDFAAWVTLRHRP